MSSKEQEQSLSVKLALLSAENAILREENAQLKIDLDKVLKALKAAWESLPFIIQLVELFKGKFTWLKVLGHLGKISKLLNAILDKFKNGKELAGDLGELPGVPGTGDTL